MLIPLLQIPEISKKKHNIWPKKYDMFSSMDCICDMIRHRAQYDVTIMLTKRVKYVSL